MLLCLTSCPTASFVLCLHSIDRITCLHYDICFGPSHYAVYRDPDGLTSHLCLYLGPEPLVEKFVMDI